VHIPQLFDPLLSRAYVEVVEALLPQIPRPLIGLVHFASKPHLQDLHYRGGVSDLRFGDEQVEVLRHYHIPDYFEAVNGSDFFEEVQEEVAAYRTREERLTVVTAAGDEVEVVVSIDSVKTSGHVGMVEDGLRSICDY
jgi:hypothetical protein